MADNRVNNLATLMFSETKDLNDAHGIANVVTTRMKSPNRFGEGLQGVITMPDQFSGYNGDEWNKVVNGTLTEDEEKIFKNMLPIARRALTGELEDITGGADHYYNPKLAEPTWGNLQNPESVKQWENFYPQTYSNDSHSYHKETLKTKRLEKSSKNRAFTKDTDFPIAFKKAREANLEEFEWDGKKYNTKMK